MASEHFLKLLGDAERAFKDYLDEKISLETLQNTIQGISAAFESEVDDSVRDCFEEFPERIEEIIYMEFPKKRRSLVEAEISKIREIVSTVKA